MDMNKIMKNKQGGARIGAGRKKVGDVNYKRTVTQPQKIELDKLLKTLRDENN